jgi:hypothetical protein
VEIEASLALKIGNIGRSLSKCRSYDGWLQIPRKFLVGQSSTVHNGISPYAELSRVAGCQCGEAGISGERKRILPMKGGLTFGAMMNDFGDWAFPTEYDCRYPRSEGVRRLWGRECVILIYLHERTLPVTVLHSFQHITENALRSLLPNPGDLPCWGTLHPSQISQSNRYSQDQKPPRNTRVSFVRQSSTIRRQTCESSRRVGKEVWSRLPSPTRKPGKSVKYYSERVADRKQRIVFANTFDSVRHLWITNQSALISRPTLHTFHTVVSSSQGFTIGTSPWDESCKQRRKAAATALNRPAVQSYMPIIDLESNVSIKEILDDSGNGKMDIDPIAYFQRFALNTSLTLNYGNRIDGKIDDELLKEICDVERAISNFRSTSNNWQDYIPLMRLLPKSSDEAVEWRGRRDKYMTFLLNRLKKQIEEGSDKPCITGNILKDPEAKLNESE